MSVKLLHGWKTMSHNIPLLVLASPLLAALAVNLFGSFSRKIIPAIVEASLAASFCGALCVLSDVIRHGAYTYTVGGWRAPYGIELVVDPLAAVMLVLVSLVALLSSGVAVPTVFKSMPNKTHLFFALYLIHVAGMLGMVLSGDAFNMYVLLEIVSITSYGLVAMGNGPALFASINYIMMGTVGACFYLLGVGYLYVCTGSLNMGHIAQLLPSAGSQMSVIAAFCFIILGLLIKMGFFPLHSWLPNAYSSAPRAAGALLAPLMTKVMIYLMIRFAYSVFSFDFVTASLPFFRDALIGMSSIGVIVCSVMAYRQNNFVRMFTYVIIAEVCYMTGSLWIGSRMSLYGTVFHIFNDSLMTLSVFCIANIFFYCEKRLNLKDFKNIFDTMPFVACMFVLCALSIIGIPPFCGFFSKWYLLLGGLESHRYFYVASLLFSSITNMLIFARFIQMAFPSRSSESAHSAKKGQAVLHVPFSMRAVLCTLTLLFLLIGLNAGGYIENMLKLIADAM